MTAVAKNGGTGSENAPKENIDHSNNGGSSLSVAKGRVNFTRNIMSDNAAKIMPSTIQGQVASDLKIREKKINEISSFVSIVY